jgi:hypothetical protein
MQNSNKTSCQDKTALTRSPNLPNPRLSLKPQPFLLNIKVLIPQVKIGYQYFDTPKIMDA